VADPSHVQIALQGRDAVTRWWVSHPGERLDLVSAGLAGARLVGADLSLADLTRADLSLSSLRQTALAGADLRGANLRGADLAGADLRGADLTGASLRGATLTDVQLAGATLERADLRHARLRLVGRPDANLAEASFGRTAIEDSDLGAVVGLADVRHLGPSSLDTATLLRTYRGAGDRLTPDLRAFCGGAGVSPALLDRLGELARADRHYPCFVWCAEPEAVFAARLVADLRARGVQCWLHEEERPVARDDAPDVVVAGLAEWQPVIVVSTDLVTRGMIARAVEWAKLAEPRPVLIASRDEQWRGPRVQVRVEGRDLGPWLRMQPVVDFSDQARYSEALRRLQRAVERPGRWRWPWER